MNTNMPNEFMMNYNFYIRKVKFMEDLAKKWCINEKLHQAMLDQNARLEKEYQQMMLPSLVSTSWEAQIANEFKSVSEYGHSNPLWEFQLTSWPKVDPFFPDEYPQCPDGNQT
jgi:hypothetical protein